jgi:exonuclease III
MDSDQQQYKKNSWNVRGLNSPARQEEVKQVIQIYRPDLVCLQETKMESVSQLSIRNALGHVYQDNYMPFCQQLGLVGESSSLQTI